MNLDTNAIQDRLNRKKRILGDCEIITKKIKLIQAIIELNATKPVQLWCTVGRLGESGISITSISNHLYLTILTMELDFYKIELDRLEKQLQMEVAAI